MSIRCALPVGGRLTIAAGALQPVHGTARCHRAGVGAAPMQHVWQLATAIAAFAHVAMMTGPGPLSVSNRPTSQPHSQNKQPIRVSVPNRSSTGEALQPRRVLPGLSHDDSRTAGNGIRSITTPTRSPFPPRLHSITCCFLLFLKRSEQPKSVKHYAPETG